MAQYLAVFNGRFFKYGIPFLLLVVGGSFGLKEFTQIRFKYSKKKLIDPDEMKEHGVEMKSPKEVTLETEFEKIKDLADKDWENIRGPRPWEPETLKNFNT